MDSYTDIDSYSSEQQLFQEFTANTLTSIIYSEKQLPYTTGTYNNVELTKLDGMPCVEFSGEYVFGDYKLFLCGNGYCFFEKSEPILIFSLGESIPTDSMSDTVRDVAMSLE